MSTPRTTTARADIDPRGPRFGAAVTLLLLIAVLLLGTSPAAYVVLAVVVAGFALGAFGGIGRTWQGWVFRTVRPSRGSPRRPSWRTRGRRLRAGWSAWSSPVPGCCSGWPGSPSPCPWRPRLALVAAFLNAVFGLCLGCRALPAAGLRLRAGRSAQPSG